MQAKIGNIKLTDIIVPIDLHDRHRRILFFLLLRLFLAGRGLLDHGLFGKRSLSRENRIQLIHYFFAGIFRTLRIPDIVTDQSECGDNRKQS